ncbi:MAG: class I SAM-dependent DNA methyltransferase [Gemmatimonadaceae bacterium]|nr:class I SAM-dependent DNA methyltransferase [Gemmatimonadaceae bacterium]
MGVEPPRPAGSGYEFEYAIKVVARDGTESTNFIDLYKRNHFALEAKDDDAGKLNDVLLRKAFGQVRNYVGSLPDERPPYIMVLDVGKTLMIWDRWNGDYGGFNAGKRVDLKSLAGNAETISLLSDIWENPSARDPRAKAVAVTTEIATHLAELAAGLERRGHDQERVAKFLMRCVFTMFAEDVGLLQDEPFRRAVEEIGYQSPEEFAIAVSDLWKAMDEGKRFGLKKLLRFNGHFFRDVEVLPLTREEIAVLHEAAKADWSHVEPSIFGTLLVRALDPIERHRLGAEYTPRAYIERLVKPTVEDPIRERWTRVQAEVLQLRESKKKKDKGRPVIVLRKFHEWMRSLRFLDPACGSGNFLYVTMHTVKRIELEVVHSIEEITGEKELRLDEVDPSQFYGLEIKPWAREVAELTLWIGFHQFWMMHHHVQPPEPILRDTGTLECRDAVLEWKEIVDDPGRARPDPTPRIVSAVTGRLVPDPAAVRPYFEYRGATEAKWPDADFIIGNPPYLGQARQRDAFGDGYVDALRAAYAELPDTSDLVMYWWYHGAKAVSSGKTIRAGFLTTNTITQSQNRSVIAAAEKDGAHVIWAVADHPWSDETSGAAVRVAMTVLSRDVGTAVLMTVDDNGSVPRATTVKHLNSDLTSDADVGEASGAALRSNAGLAHRGFQLIGSGFMLENEEAESISSGNPIHAQIVRPYRNAKDLNSRPRGVQVIDFGMRSEEEARTYPVLFDLVRNRVKPERDANGRAAYANYWWRFGEPRPQLRAALTGLKRYITTGETSKHRFFVFLDSAIAPDNMLVCIASSDAFHLGVLSSSIHVTWALAAGGTLEDRPRYNKGRCFDAFPLPQPQTPLRSLIGVAAERLDKHRRDGLARDARVTMTGMYNVVEKLRSGEPLTDGERGINILGACGVLRDLHDEIDVLVSRAYGWPADMSSEMILDRLVALHDTRLNEEKAGQVAWLRPDYQIPRFGAEAETPPSELDLTETPVARESLSQLSEWPEKAIDQLAALQLFIARLPATVPEITKALKGSKREHVERHLETLALMGEMEKTPDGKYHNAKAT